MKIKDAKNIRLWQYSERGAVNALIRELLRDGGEKVLTNLLMKSRGFSGGHLEVESIDHALVEFSLSDNGNPDVVLLLKMKDTEEKIALFIEAKAQGSRGSGSVLKSYIGNGSSSLLNQVVREIELGKMFEEWKSERLMRKALRNGVRIAGRLRKTPDDRPVTRAFLHMLWVYSAQWLVLGLVPGDGSKPYTEITKQLKSRYSEREFRRALARFGVLTWGAVAKQYKGERNELSDTLELNGKQVLVKGRGKSAW